MEIDMRRARHVSDSTHDEEAEEVERALDEKPDGHGEAFVAIMEPK